MGELEGKKHVQYIVSVEKVLYAFIIDLFLCKTISFALTEEFEHFHTYIRRKTVLRLW